MDIKHKLAAGAAAISLLGLGSLGLGVANAQSSTPPPAASTQAPSTAATPEAPGATGATEAPGTPEAADATEAADTAPDDPNGHADPEGVDVQNVGGATEP
jgi:hypothetical protein